MLAGLSAGMEQEQTPEPLAPAEFYRQYHTVMSDTEKILGHAYRVSDQFQAWQRPVDASRDIQKVDAIIQELNALPDRVRDEVYAALRIQNGLILDTVHEATSYLSKLDLQPRIAAQNIVAEYRTRLLSIESELSREESIQEK